MRRIEIEKAAHGLSQSASGVGEQSSIQIQGNGLNANLMAKGLPVADRRVAGLHEARADGSGRRPLSANMPVPLLRSANPHGVALLLAERGGFRQFNLGACHE